MESTKNRNNIELEKMELVLNEILSEQKETNKSNSDIIEAINRLNNKISEFDKKLENINITAPQPDLKPFQQILSKGIIDISLIATKQPQPIVRKFQILLFPEQDARLFYKIVFGRWFLLLVISFAIVSTYRWAIHNSDNKARIELELIKNNKTTKAWDLLYKKENKVLHRQMDSALIKVLNSQ